MIYEPCALCLQYIQKNKIRHFFWGQKNAMAIYDTYIQHVKPTPNLSKERSWFLGFQYYLLGRSNCVSCITEVWGPGGKLGSWDPDDLGYLGTKNRRFFSRAHNMTFVAQAKEDPKKSHGDVNLSQNNEVESEFQGSPPMSWWQWLQYSQCPRPRGAGRLPASSDAWWLGGNPRAPSTESHGTGHQNEVYHKLSASAHKHGLETYGKCGEIWDKWHERIKRFQELGCYVHIRICFFV